jgi:RNA polymerase sigma factor (sigma-70 family)
MNEGSDPRGSASDTRPSLLIRLRDPQDEASWRQFVEYYGPILYRFARRCRLQDADASDLTQVVLQAVSQGMARFQYDPLKGSFKSWLFTLARNHLHKLRARAARDERVVRDPQITAFLSGLSGDQNQEKEVFELEHKRQLFRAAAQLVRGQIEETSWKAFWLTAVEGRGAKDAAQLLKMTPGAVYTAKSRVLDRIRVEIERVRNHEYPPWDDEGRSSADLP